MHKVEQIQLLSNGECLIKVTQTKFKILLRPADDADENDLNNFLEITNKMSLHKKMGPFEVWTLDAKEELYFRTKSVILATGGKQIVHP